MFFDMSFARHSRVLSKRSKDSMKSMGLFLVRSRTGLTQTKHMHSCLARRRSKKGVYTCYNYEELSVCPSVSLSISLFLSLHTIDDGIAQILQRLDHRQGHNLRRPWVAS